MYFNGKTGKVTANSEMVITKFDFDGNFNSSVSSVTRLMFFLVIINREDPNPKEKNIDNVVALFQKVLKLTEFCLQSGVSVNAKNERGETPLLQYCRSFSDDDSFIDDLEINEFKQMIDLLVKYGASVNDKVVVSMS